MTHLTEEEMVSGYYAGLSVMEQDHLASCADCKALYRQIRETFEAANETVVPERGSAYGSEVWARLSSELPSRRNHLPLRPLLFFAAAAVLVALILIVNRPVANRNLTATVPVARTQPLPIANSPAPLLKPRQVVQSTHKKTSDVKNDQRLLSLSDGLEANPKAAVPEIVGIIQSDNNPDRYKEHALFVLAQSDSAEAHQAVMKFARQAPNPQLQTKAIRMIEMLGNNDERKELTVLYKQSSDPALKQEILNGSMFSVERNATTQKKQILNSVFLATDSHVLLEMLKKQPDVATRAATIRSLALAGDQSSVLTDIYWMDREEEVRRAVLDALVMQQNSEALSKLAENETDDLRKAEILNRLAAIRPAGIQIATPR